MFRHDLPPIPIDKFMAAVELGRQRVREAVDEELAEMPINQPISDPEKYRTRLWGDNEASHLMAAIETFDGDHDLALSSQFRRSFVLRLITKRRFRRFRRETADGWVEVNETFLKAVCGMPFTHSMSRRRRITKRALAREIRRLERIERKQAHEPVKPDCQ
jgi:hypothetical protein